MLAISKQSLHILNRGANLRDFVTSAEHRHLQAATDLKYRFAFRASTVQFTYQCISPSLVLEKRTSDCGILENLASFSYRSTFSGKKNTVFRSSARGCNTLSTPLDELKMGRIGGITVRLACAYMSAPALYERDIRAGQQGPGLYAGYAPMMRGHHIQSNDSQAATKMQEA